MSSISTINTSALHSLRELLRSVYSDEEIKFCRKLLSKSADKLAEFEKELQAFTPPTVEILRDTSTIFEKVGIAKILGKGGSKKALLLTDGRVLLVPNTDVDSLDEIQQRWKRMVDEECKMSEFLQKVGLLGLQLLKVKVRPQMGSEEEFVACITDSFDALKAKQLYVIDRKNHESSTWGGKCRLFEESEKAKKSELSEWI